MLNKRKRNSENPRRLSAQKNESLPLASEKLTEYHVNQLQESNRLYRQKIDELERRISQMIQSIGSSSDGVDSDITKLKSIISSKDDEILALQNENKRMVMQKIHTASFGCNVARGNVDEDGDSNFKKTSSHTESNNIDLNICDMYTKLSTKEREIEELTRKNKEITDENVELRRKFSVFVPCKTDDAGEEDLLNNYVCKCMETYSSEINRLESELKSEKRKVLDFLNNDLVRNIKEFIESRKNCELHAEMKINELSEVKGRYDSLKADFDILEKKCRALEVMASDQAKKIKDLEHAANKAELGHNRMIQVIDKINKSLGSDKDNGILNDLMSEYEELSTAFEEKNIECDSLRQKIQESEEKCAKCTTGLEKIEQTLEELETVRILYDEKLSLIRKNRQSEIQYERELDARMNGRPPAKNHHDFFHKLEQFLSPCQSEKGGRSVSSSEQVLKYRTIVDRLESEVKFNKNHVSSLQDKLAAAEENNRKNVETISILRERVQYIINKVNRLTNLKIDINKTEQNEHLKLDDVDVEINKLKSENQQMLTLMKCSVCRDKLKDTVINRCGHLFCKECIHNNLSSRNRKCPLCHTTFDRNDTIKVFLE